MFTLIRPQASGLQIPLLIYRYLGYGLGCKRVYLNICSTISLWSSFCTMSQRTPLSGFSSILLQQYFLITCYWTLVNLVVVGEEYSLFLIKPRSFERHYIPGSLRCDHVFLLQLQPGPHTMPAFLSVQKFFFLSLPSAAVDFHQCLKRNDVCCPFSHRVGLLLCLREQGLGWVLRSSFTAALPFPHVSTSMNTFMGLPPIFPVNTQWSSWRKKTLKEMHNFSFCSSTGTSQSLLGVWLYLP